MHCTNAQRRFGDSELAAIRPLAPQTVWLNLSGTCITDAGLATVGAIPKPHAAASQSDACVGQGLAQLAGLQHLEYLNLYGTGVTDAGWNRWPPERLRTLYVWQTA